MTVHEHFDRERYIHDHPVGGGQHLHRPSTAPFAYLETVQENQERRLAEVEAFIEGLKVYVAGP